VNLMGKVLLLQKVGCSLDEDPSTALSRRYISKKR